MLRVIKYGFLGIILGTSAQFCRFFYKLGGPDFLLEISPYDSGELLTRLSDLLGQFRTDGLLGLLGGLGVGLVIGVFVINLGSPRKIFPYGRTIRYELATCRWCGGDGKNFHLIPCRACKGNGSILAPKPHRKCAWCRGTGREPLGGFLRCRVCDGTGWAFGQLDDG